MNCCESSSVNDSLIHVTLEFCTLSLGGCFGDAEQGPAHSPWVMQSRNLFGLVSSRSPGILTSGAGLQLHLHWQPSGGLSS